MLSIEEKNMKSIVDFFPYIIKYKDVMYLLYVYSNIIFYCDLNANILHDIVFKLSEIEGDILKKIQTIALYYKLTLQKDFSKISDNPFIKYVNEIDKTYIVDGKIIFLLLCISVSVDENIVGEKCFVRFCKATIEKNIYTYNKRIDIFNILNSSQSIKEIDEVIKILDFNSLSEII